MDNEFIRKIRASYYLIGALLGKYGNTAVALPGGCGTMEELLEIITWKQSGLYFKPIVILNINGFFTPLLEMLQRAIDENFMREEHGSIWQVAQNAEEAVELLFHTPMWDEKVRKYAAI